MDNYTRAMAYLEKLPAAVSGSGGHNSTLLVACECFRFGLSLVEAYEALTWYNANRCQPQWKEHELRHKLSDAEKIVNARGEHAVRVRDADRRHVRSFVPPAKLAPKQDDRPMCQRPEQEEELWWSRVAVALGTTLEQFDEACGNA